MSHVKTSRSVLVLGMLVACGSVQAQDAQSTPSVESIIESLRADAPVDGSGKSRSILPGKPVKDRALYPGRPKPASVNMQINFEYNSSEIAGSSVRTMATLAKALASPQLEGRKFAVIGHTDAKGPAAYNKALSDRRAAAVRRYLTENGVAASRLKATGKGESQLLNSDDPNAAENRRVEIQATGG